MADDADQISPDEEREPSSSTPTPGPSGTPVRTPRAPESWEPQQRAPRRPDFLDRLAKTTDLPTEAPKERQKSKLGEHRLAAIHWEEEEVEDGESAAGGRDGSEEGTATLTRGQVATLASLGVVVAVLGVMWFAKSLIMGEGPPPPPPVVVAAGSATADVPAALTDLEYAQATEVMTRFLEALTPEDLRLVIREPDRVWPLVQAHHERTPWKPFIVRRLPAKTEVQMNRGLLAGSVEVNDFERFVVAMERTADGFKVDWETFTGQGEMTWDDFVSQRPTTPVLMRVALRPDDYFNQDFADASTHACFQLTSHRDTHRLFGYVLRGSPLHAQLATRTRFNPRILPTIRIRYPEKSTTDDQVEITELVADGWLLAEATRVKEGEVEAPTADGKPDGTPPPAAPVPQ
jgi:hypothetical protein